MSEIKVKCEKCNGDGWYLDHDPNDPQKLRWAHFIITIIDVYEMVYCKLTERENAKIIYREVKEYLEEHDE